MVNRFIPEKTEQTMSPAAHVVVFLPDTLQGQNGLCDRSNIGCSAKEQQKWFSADKIASMIFFVAVKSALMVEGDEDGFRSQITF